MTATDPRSRQDIESFCQQTAHNGLSCSGQFSADSAESRRQSVRMNRKTSMAKTDGFCLRLYPPIWFLLFAAAAFILSWLWPLHLPLPALIQPFAFVVAASGGVLALWAALMFRRHNTTAHPYADATHLVTHGPYRISRNPMYLGLLLTLIALGLWLQSLASLLLAPLFVAVINRCNILPEEHRLKARFGQEYETYLALTRRWF